MISALKHFTARLSLQQKNMFIFSCVIMIALISGGVILHSLNKAKEDTDITNALGRQRMLSQMMGKTALGTAMAKSRKRTIEQQINILDDYVSNVRAVYTSDVIGSAKKARLNISMEPEKEHRPAVPFPATLMRKINEKFGAKGGFALDIIAEDPINPAKKIKSEMDKEALAFLKKSPDQVYTKINETDGKLFMNLFTADIATVGACASCHTEYKDQSFKVGDLLGIRNYRLLYSEDVALGKLELQAGMDEYEKHRKLFEQTLNAAKNGGKYFIDMEMKDARSMPLISDETVQEKIVEVEKLFKEFNSNVTLLLNSEVNSTPYRKALQKILSDSNLLLHKSDNLVNAYASLANQNQRNIRLAVIISTLITFIIMLWVMFFMKNTVVRPISTLSKALKEMSLGNFKQEKLIATSSDEIGTLAETYNMLLGTMRDIVNQSEDIAAGNFDRNYEMKGELSHSFTKMRQELADKKIQNEDLRQKVDSILIVINAAAGGDLTQKVNVVGKDAIGQMGEGLVVFFKKLSESLHGILKNSDMLARSANEISSTIHEQSSVITEQTSSVTEISATVEELASSSMQVAMNADSVAEFAINALQESEQGMNTMENLKTKMDEITEDNNNGIKEVLSLGRKSDEIGKVMGIINSIADQTKLIAFNAAIEAASAGEAGKRFSVVAVEIRRLADNVMQSTGDIQSKVDQIQQAINRLVVASEKGSKRIHEGTDLMNHTMAELEKLVDGSKATADAASQISLSSRQQKTAIDQVLLALREIVKGSNQSSAAIKQTSAVSTQLSEMSNELKVMLSKFKVDKNV